MEVELLDGVGDVMTGEYQILEGPDETSELSWISNIRPRKQRRLWPMCSWVSRPTYSPPCQSAQGR
jgi:hypothetical protein